MADSFRLLVAALENVPYAGDAAADRNGELIEATDSDIVVVTETWDERVKDQVREENPDLRFLTAPGQSVMLGHNPKRFRVLDSGRMMGGGGPLIPGLSDRRDLFYKVLQDKITGKIVAVIAIHTPPIRPKLGRTMVLRALAAHAAARVRIRTFMRNRKAKVVVAGDFNTTHLVKVLRVAGGHIGNGIVHAELEEPIRSLQSKPVRLRSNHLGVQMDLVA